MSVSSNSLIICTDPLFVLSEYVFQCYQILEQSFRRIHSSKRSLLDAYQISSVKHLVMTIFE